MEWLHNRLAIGSIALFLLRVILLLGGLGERGTGRVSSGMESISYGVDGCVVAGADSLVQTGVGSCGLAGIGGRRGE